MQPIQSVYVNYLCMWLLINSLQSLTQECCVFINCDLIELFPCRYQLLVLIWHWRKGEKQKSLLWHPCLERLMNLVHNTCFTCQNFLWMLWTNFKGILLAIWVKLKIPKYQCASATSKKILGGLSNPSADRGWWIFYGTTLSSN